jgi:predicted short-subunit dehydrogenase-like oxidoreductase (DUF2520 family)
MGKKVFIIGCGAVGTSLGKALKNAGRDIIGIFDIDAARAGDAAITIGVQGFAGALPEIIKQADTVLVTVPDHVIGKVAQWALAEDLCRGNQIWIHCSGHLNKEVLSPIESRVKGTGSMHPAFVFPPARCTSIPPGVFFAIGGTEEAIKKAKEHVALLKGNPVEIAPDKRAVYHAAMVMSSNYIVALLAQAREILETTGLDFKEIERLLFSLADSAMDRAKKLGLEHSLSGPIRRGDVGTVKDHMNAIKDIPMAKELYISAGLATVELASKQPGFCKDTALTLKELLR